MAKLTLDEQEVTINMLRTEDDASIYCSDSTWITKMDKLVKKSPQLFKVTNETDVGKTYKFPKRLVSIRSTIRHCPLTEEQRKAAAERLRGEQKE